MTPERPIIGSDEREASSSGSVRLDGRGWSSCCSWSTWSSSATSAVTG